jgi:very-short-patch-repair endonuclease
MLYNQLGDEEKKKLIKKLYIDENKSFADIAEACGTYANKIRRDAIRLKINIRNKSEAQKNALVTGKHTHPTKGRKRSEATKRSIGNSVLKSWSQLSEEEIKDRKSKARAAWNLKTEDEKEQLLSMANKAVREASKVGSKLENFLLTKLIEMGYRVDFHKEQILTNTKLQIDLFLPTINTAIEVDGPSHFAPVWGEDSLKKNKAYDNKKSGLILGKGWNIIRIKQYKDFSPTRAENILQQLLSTIDEIQNNNKQISSFTIEDK